MRAMEEALHIATHVLEHSVSDTLYLIPFLYVTYLLMEWLEHRTSAKSIEAIRCAGAAGPVVGAVAGVVPQCGFSAVASTLWAGRVITLGTLFAVYLSTSDEMLPIFLAEQVDPLTIAKVLGAKVVIGMVMGFLVDAAVRLARRESRELRIRDLCEQDHCHCEDCDTCGERLPEFDRPDADDCEKACDDAAESHAAIAKAVDASARQATLAADREALADVDEGSPSPHAHDHEHVHAHDGHHHTHTPIWKSALVHTAQVVLFIFVITIVLNTVLEVVGEDALAGALSGNPVLATFGAAAVGLIPNCAASVVIAQLYLEGALGAAPMLAGLLVSAGVGLLVLVRTNRHAGQNALIIAALYLTGVFWGLMVGALGITF